MTKKKRKPNPPPPKKGIHSGINYYYNQTINQSNPAQQKKYLAVSTKTVIFRLSCVTTTGFVTDQFMLFVVIIPLILDVRLVDAPAGVTQEGRSHRISHPPSFCGASLTFYRARRIQSSLSLVDREVECEKNKQITTILTFFPLTEGCSEGLGAFRFFFKQQSNMCYFLMPDRLDNQ